MIRTAAITLLALTPAASGAAAATRPLDLHQVRWSEVTIPGRVCGARPPIRLHRKQAVVASRRFSGYRRVHVDSGWNGVRYGDLDGDRTDEAAFIVDCNNGGGTADGVLAYADVVFSGAGGRLHTLGVLTARQRYTPGTRYPPIVTVAHVAPGKVTVSEGWYGRNDSVCCASGRATTTWLYRNGKLHPGRTKVLRQPRP